MRFQELSTEQFATRLTSILNDAATALMISLGHRLGLFDAMAELELASSQQIADATGCHERYVREWLGALVTAGVVEFLPEAQSYSLPKTHAALLTRSATPNNVAVFAQYIPMLGSVEELIFVMGAVFPMRPMPDFIRLWRRRADKLLSRRSKSIFCRWSTAWIRG